MWPTLFYGNGNLFPDAGKCFGHAVKASEHFVLSFFENTPHKLRLRVAK
jgi:hypothetical protein